MLPRWRRLLSWFLVLWLPLHGGAALALGLCAAMQLQDVAVTTEAAAPCHGHGAADAAPAAAEHDASGAHDGGACAHCAACQVQPAAVPVMPLLAQPALPGGWTASVPITPTERSPDSLERPPRVAHA